MFKMSFVDILKNTLETHKKLNYFKNQAKRNE